MPARARWLDLCRGAVLGSGHKGYPGTFGVAGVRATVAWLALVLLAGCSSPPAGEEGLPAGPVVQERVPTVHDNLTARLHPASGAFFPDLWPEDEVDLPGGGNISLSSGLGIRCEGNATAMQPEGTGWVTCALRLASDPAALVVSRRQFELGFDYQPLSTRTPAEPVEWRVTVELDRFDATDNASRLEEAFDSGWRPIDFTPRVAAPALAVTVEEPCDTADEFEGPAGFPHRGTAVLNVSFVVLSHAQVRIGVDVGASVLMTPGGWPVADDVTITPHAMEVTYPAWGSEQAMWLLVPVDLETDALPGSATPGAGPCPSAFAHEAQYWRVVLTYVGADGSGSSHETSIPFDVYVGLPE